ncbi:MAG: class I SAM-dependent methyltransferase [candidate division NC10 bacterium]|nr:class I SAM-dependent methyltransferase [candidate division NC10 bacterium]
MRDSWSGPILELTAGTGRATIALVGERRSVVCLDPPHPMLQGLVRRFAPLTPRPVCAGASALPFAARTFGLLGIPFNSLGEITEATIGGRGGGSRSGFAASAERRLPPLPQSHRVLDEQGENGGCADARLAAMLLEARELPD